MMDLFGKNVFITSCGGLGDLIVCTPALRRLKEKYQCHITFLCQDKHREVLTGLPYVDKVVCIERGKFLGRYKCIWEGALYKQDYVIFTDWNPVALTACHLLGVPNIAGISRPGHRLNDYMTRHITNHVFAETGYAAASNAVTYGEALGVELDGDMTDIEIASPSNGDIAKVHEMLHSIGCQEGKYILMAPFTSIKQKDWPVEQAREYVKQAEKKYGLPVVVVGTANNKSEADQISSYNLTGSTTILEMVQLIKSASFMIAADSGPMHIAGAVGTPIVAMFSKELPSKWAPRHKCETIYLALPCSPCDNETLYQCKDFKCSRHITAEMAIEATDKLLARLKP